MNYRDIYGCSGGRCDVQSDSWGSLEDEVRPDAPELTSSSSVGEGGQGVNGGTRRSEGWMDSIWRRRNGGRIADVEGGSEGSQRDWVPQWVRKYMETQGNPAPRKDDSRKGKQKNKDGRGMRSMEPESAEVWRASGEEGAKGCGPVDPMNPVAVVAEVKTETMTKESCNEEDPVVHRKHQKHGRNMDRMKSKKPPVTKDEMRRMEGGNGSERAVCGEVKKDGVSEPAPDRFIGLNERYKKQLRTCQKDQYGVPLQNTARRFSYFASPFQVAEVCTGLGVYLVSLRAAILLAIMLSILMIYPLVENIKTQNWSDVYYLYVEVSAMPTSAVCTCVECLQLIDANELFSTST
jgi:hypothetical protein